MHNREKFPEIFSALEAATAEENELMKPREEKKAQIKANRAKIDELQAANAAIKAEMNKEADTIREVRIRRSRLAMAMGSRRLGGA